MSKSIIDIYARRGKRGEVERFDFSGAEAKKEIDQYINTIKATKEDLDADKEASAEYADRAEKAASSAEQSASSVAGNAADAISAAEKAKKSADDAAKVKASVDISAGDATSAAEESRKIKEEITASVKTAADSATTAGKSAEAAAESARAAEESADKLVDKLPEAVNDALAQAAESGEFDGADGKSAYQYAVEGGYTKTEAEFAEKLAQEPLIGTTSTLNPTQVYNAVSAGIPVKVQYTDSTYGLFSFMSFNVAESMNVIVANTIASSYDMYILGELVGNKSENAWKFMTTVLAEKSDIPATLPNPNALTIKIGSTNVTYDGSTAQTVMIDDGTEVAY